MQNNKMNGKKVFVSPKAEIIDFSANSVITTSGEDWKSELSFRYEGYGNEFQW